MSVDFASVKVVIKESYLLTYLLIAKFHYAIQVCDQVADQVCDQDSVMEFGF